MGMEQITKRGVLVAGASSHMAALIGVMLRTIGRKDIREAYDADRAMLELHRRPFDLLISCGRIRTAGTATSPSS